LRLGGGAVKRHLAPKSRQSRAAYVGVKTTLEGQASKDDERRAQELAAIRRALHTEVGLIANVCIHELRHWQRILHVVGQKDPRTAFFPPLTIYHPVSGNIGRLTRGKIVSLISFAGTLHDIEIVATRIDKNTIQAKHDQETIALLLSNACGSAAEFYEAVLDIPDANLDEDFVVQLKTAFVSSSRLSAGYAGRAERRW
jgi:hypothetical protein